MLMNATVLPHADGQNQAEGPNQLNLPTGPVLLQAAGASATPRTRRGMASN